jgi:HAD superfamily hydrolase (TIGR01509 family)
MVINTYIFDLDDTIIDSSIYSKMYNSVINELISTLNITEIELQKIISKLKEETEKERVDTFDLCKKLHSVELYYKVLERFVKHTYSLKTKNIPAIFRKIHGAKKRIGIISNAQERTIELFLRRFNLYDYVQFVESGNKNTVLFWLTLERKYKLDKEFTMVIDDSDKILNMAEHAGFKVLNVKNINDIEKFSI